MVNFVDSSQEFKDFFFKENSSIDLSIGQVFYNFNEVPKKIIHIKEGELRLIYKDKSGEIHTINKYKEGEIVGIEQIIFFTPYTAIKACNSVKGDFINVPKCLEYLELNPKSYNFFFDINQNDYLKVLVSLENQLKIRNPEFYKITNNKEFRNRIKHELYKPGIHKLKNKSNYILLGSSNIERNSNNSFLKYADEFEVTGNLPGKLLYFEEDLIEILQAYSFKNKSKNFEPLDNKVFDSLQEEKEVLTDIYGSIGSQNKFPHYKSYDFESSILATLRMLSRFFDLPFRKDILKRILDDKNIISKKKDFDLSTFAALINFIGLRTIPLKPKSKDLIKRIPFPSVFISDNKPLIIWEIQKNSFLISDSRKKQFFINIDDFEKLFYSENFKILFLEKSPSSPKNRFGISWFMPVIKKYKRTLFQIIIASFFVQLLALFNPLLIQQIIDAVINQGNISSLNVLGTLLIAMALAQALLSSLRTYLFSDTTNRIDLPLGGKIIHHLLRLPSQYFAKRTVGETSNRLSELEKIREFLTGTALTLLLDVIFSFIYIAVMMIYSIQLTFVALAVIPFFILLTLSVSPLIRKQISDKNIANANLQSHMVETLSSVDTIKGQSIEIPSEWKWGQLYGKQRQAGFKSTITRSISGSTSLFLSQLSGLLIIWAGAILVLEGKLSIGQLIAFRILSGYVTSPILRLTTMWQNFQETSLSLERISDIIDNKQEIEINGANLPPIPPITGKIEFKNISFKFQENSPLILKNINFKINPKKFIAVAGESGSGKSTLLKLINQIYISSSGTIKIDDFDISKVNLYSLRSQIGVVPQESILFKGTIQQNIALAKPDSTFEEITSAAKLANAHEFIQNLSSGYSSEIGEKGSNLSGGQRQRIAMARMFLQSPKLLLLDEATSSLDRHSENIIFNNLLEISKKNTIIFISHRLSNFHKADEIFFMHEGTIVERGNHKELIALNGRYKNLYESKEN